MTEPYAVALEISGPAAIWTRPDTGAAPISYPVPTYSASRGLFDAVLRRPHLIIRPTRVEVCLPIRYERYVTNYGGPLRSDKQVKGRNNYQLFATILVDVCYRIFAEVRAKATGTEGRRRNKVRRRHGQDWRAWLTQMFNERLAHGQTFYTPCLGWKEFVPTYFGPLREMTRPDPSVNVVIPSLLYSPWQHRQLKPTFRQDWEVVNGVMSYEHRRPSDAE